MGSLRVGGGDLLLCRDCDKERHRLWLESRNAASNNVSENTSSTVSEPEIPSSESSITRPFILPRSINEKQAR